jgi:hypothetical protein
LVGCAGQDSRPPSATADQQVIASTSLRAPGIITQLSPAAPAGPSARPWQMPATVAMPGGGGRIDMRGSPKHVRALERQADGTFKQVCADAPQAPSMGGTR